MFPKSLHKVLREMTEGTTKNIFIKLQRKIGWLWFDVRWLVKEQVLKHTVTLRLYLSKNLIISSEHLFEKAFMWDDVQVQDAWGFWLPLGFGLCSRLMWEEDNKMNRELGYPEEPWQDVKVNKDWETYWYKDDYLNQGHYFDAARKYLAKKIGNKVYDKLLEFRLTAVSQKDLDVEQKRYLDWVQGGMQPYKISLTDQAKEDFENLFGKDEAKELIDHFEKKEGDDELNDKA
jgi:hypothetical protein